MKPIKSVADGDNEDADADAPPQEDQVAEGEVSAKEFEYLLGMPMWSVTEERVDQLIRLMNEKKLEHDALQGKHIH